MSAHQTFNPTQTLANNFRAQLEPWLEEFETHARNLCAQHDATCALTLVASDLVWQSIPANQTSTVRIAAGDPRSFPRPPDLGSTRTPRQQRCGCCSLHPQNEDYTVCGLQHGQQYPQHCPIGQCWGEKSEPPQDDLPRPEALHALFSRDIVDTMRAKHGVATSNDVSKIRDPCLEL